MRSEAGTPASPARPEQVGNQTRSGRNNGIGGLALAEDAREPRTTAEAEGASIAAAISGVPASGNSDRVSLPTGTAGAGDAVCLVQSCPSTSLTGAEVDPWQSAEACAGTAGAQGWSQYSFSTGVAAIASNRISVCRRLIALPEYTVTGRLRESRHDLC